MTAALPEPLEGEAAERELTEGAYPVCPVCGAAAEYFYLRDGRCAGCCDCLSETPFHLLPPELARRAC